MPNEQAEKEIIGFQLPDGLDPNLPTLFLQLKPHFTPQEIQYISQSLMTLLDNATPDELNRLAKAIKNPLMKATALKYI